MLQETVHGGYLYRAKCAWPIRRTEVPFGSAWGPAVLARPTALESDNSFTLRSPQRMTRSRLDLRGIP
eukprot:7445800-Pyramimonas_sp.AAC.1